MRDRGDRTGSERRRKHALVDAVRLRIALDVANDRSNVLAQVLRQRTEVGQPSWTEDASHR